MVEVENIYVSEEYLGGKQEFLEQAMDEEVSKDVPEFFDSCKINKCWCQSLQ